jgi:2-polyprenyl-6-methoxyphenol hydroxylase-like FAD-dependent oxidoreductase
VVVGAGPAGACLALLLARAGVVVTLVEASTSLQRQFRGEALMPSGLEALAAMGLSHLLAALPQRPLQGWRFVVNGRHLFTAREPLGGDPQRLCTLVSQPALLEALLAQTSTSPSFALERGQPVVDLLWRDGRVAGVQLRGGRQLPAELVIGGDGRSSLLRQKAALELVGAPSAIDLLWFQLAGPKPTPLDGCFTTLVGDAGVFSAFESAAGGLQIGWVLEKQAPLPALASDGWIERMASLCPPELAAWLRQGHAGLSAPTRLAVQVGLAAAWWRPGMLLLGDAAHPMSPVRAQGINAALRDAAVAARQLICLAQQPPGVAATPAPAAIDARLAAIEAERRPEVSQLQALQAEETNRGELLRQTPALRWLLAVAAPLLGGLISRRWWRQQQPLRRGINGLAAPP